MENNNFNAKKALMLTRMIWFGLLSGILFFSFVALTISSQPTFRADFSDPLFLLLLIFTCTAIPAGFFASKKYYRKADPLPYLSAKYPLYQSGLLIRMATCEGISLYSIVCLILTNNLFAIVFLAVSVIVLVTYFPNPSVIGTDLNLTESEIEQFYT